MLYTSDLSKTFILQMDTSGVALGTVVMQWVVGKMWSIAYTSQKLLGPETRYSTIEQVRLAIKWGIGLFQYYLLGRDFVLVTNHTLLKCL